MNGTAAPGDAEQHRLRYIELHNNDIMTNKTKFPTDGEGKPIKTRALRKEYHSPSLTKYV